VYRFYNKGTVFEIPTGKINIFILLNAQTGTGAHPTTYSFGTGSSFPERKITSA